MVKLWPNVALASAPTEVPLDTADAIVDDTAGKVGTDQGLQYRLEVLESEVGRMLLPKQLLEVPQRGDHGHILFRRLFISRVVPLRMDDAEPMSPVMVVSGPVSAEPLPRGEQ